MPKEQPKEVEIYRITPESPRMRILLYAEPGVGKTTLAASCQDHEDLGPVLFADVEGVDDALGHRDDIHAVRIKSTQDLEDLYYALKHGEGDFGEIKTLVIDNITQLQSINLNEIVASGETEKGSTKHKSEDDIWQEDYGVSTSRLYRLFQWFCGLDINVIFNAHAKYVYPATNSRNAAAQMNVEPLAVLPMLTQKLCKTTMGLVGYVWYLQFNAEDGNRYLLHQPDGIIQAKTRGPEFAKLIGQFTKNPTMPMVYDKLLESRGIKKSTKKSTTTTKRGK